MNWIDRTRREIAEGRRKYGLRRYIRRRLRYGWNRVFQPVDRNRIVGTLERLGLCKGDLVCVHSKFSALGYVKGGPEAFIQALQDVVGSSGTIMMPTFPTTGSVLSYVESGEVFDVRTTPSRIGVLPETFRTFPGVKRSLHPTNSVAAWGRLADALIRDHEKSLTPYGLNTPYGKLPLFKGKILMVNTHILSFSHHLQELVNFPNLYLDGTREVKYRDWNGTESSMVTRVMRPRTPYFMIISEKQGQGYDYILIQDFALTFPEDRERDLVRAGYNYYSYPYTRDRKKSLMKAGLFKAETLGSGRVGLVDVQGFLKIVKPELEDLLKRFRDAYDPEVIDSQNLTYL